MTIKEIYQTIKTDIMLELCTRSMRRHVQNEIAWANGKQLNPAAKLWLFARIMLSKPKYPSINKVIYN